MDLVRITEDMNDEEIWSIFNRFEDNGIVVLEPIINERVSKLYDLWKACKTSYKLDSLNIKAKNILSQLTCKKLTKRGKKEAIDMALEFILKNGQWKVK